MDTEKPTFRQLISDRALAAAKRFGNRLRPLLVEESGGPSAVGSGVLFRVESSLFLFTAAHVIDNREKELLIPSDTGGAVPVLGDILRSTPPGGIRADDRIDAGVIRLSADTATALRDVPAFDPNDVDLDQRVRDAPGAYLLIGFPLTQGRVRKWERVYRAGGFVLTAAAAAAEDYRNGKFDDAQNILLQYDQAHIAGLTGLVTPPRLNGISGGAIWSFGATYDSTAETARLVAIVVEKQTSPLKVIVGTRLAFFAEMVRHHFPELRAALPAPTRAHIRVKGPSP